MKYTGLLLLMAALVFPNPVKSQSFYLDNSFGTSGVVANLSKSPNSRVSDIAVQDDGKIVGILHHTQKLQCFRLLSSGEPDSSFGDYGFTEIQVTANNPNTAISLVLQDDGKILIAGIGHRQNDDIALIRLQDNGEIDQSFGSDGIVLTNTCNTCREDVRKVLLRPNGKILVAARRDEVGEVMREVLAQYNTNGTLDNSFGSGGIAVSDNEGNESNLNDAALQGDGKIVTTGYTYIGQVSNADVLVTRYNADGSIDAGFGNNGHVVKDYAAAAMEDGRKVLMQSTGRIVITCYAPRLSFLTFRLNENGSDDKGYGLNGVSALNLNLSDYSFDAMVIGNNDILIGGNVEVGGVYDYSISRLTKNGANKYQFGMNGKITTDIFGNADYLFALTQQPDGKIIAAGSAAKAVSGSPYPVIVRYVANTVNGVEEIEAKGRGLMIYPNPCYGTITIEGKEEKELHVYDLLGRLIKKVSLTSSNNFSATINDLPKGFSVLKDVTSNRAYKIETL